MTCEELAEELGRYGSLPVAVRVINGENGDESLPISDLRLELNIEDGTGMRYVAVAAYEPDQHDDDDVVFAEPLRVMDPETGKPIGLWR